MTNGSLILKTLLIAFVTGLVLVRGIIFLAHKYGVGLDKPGKGRIHNRPVSRIGGVAMYGAFMAGCLLTLGPLGISNKQVLGVVITASIVTGVGFWDDLFNLKPLPKFIGQLMAVLLAVLGFEILIRFINNPLGGTLQFGWIITLSLSTFWLLGTINVTNFLDGLDGLATGVTVIFSFILLLVALTFQQQQLSILAAALLGATLAFLLFNFSPAKLFMGDSGSMFLGLIIGELSILSGAKLATVMLILAIPIMDTAYTIVRRLTSGTKMSQRDTNHLHHRMMAAGFSQRQVCLIYYAVAGFFGFVVLIPITVVKVTAVLVACLVYVGLLIFMSNHPTIKDK